MQQAIKLAELLKSQRGDAARIIGGERSNVKGHISSPRLLLFTAYLVASSCVFFFHLYICLYGRQLFISNCSGRRGGVGDGNPNSAAQKMNRRRGPLKAKKSTKGASSTHRFGAR